VIGSLLSRLVSRSTGQFYLFLFPEVAKGAGHPQLEYLDYIHGKPKLEYDTKTTKNPPKMQYSTSLTPKQEYNTDSSSGVPKLNY
jgi:hypothetical protein